MMHMVWEGEEAAEDRRDTDREHSSLSLSLSLSGRLRNMLAWSLTGGAVVAQEVERVDR